MAVTRAKLICPVYGIGCELTSRQLPKVQEVMQHYFFSSDTTSKDNEI
jgi:hypothetical protein